MIALTHTRISCLSDHHSLCKDVFQYLQYLILKPPDSTAPSYILEDRHNTNPCCHLLKLTHSHTCADCPADTQNNKDATWAHRELSAQCRHQSDFFLLSSCSVKALFLWCFFFAFWLLTANSMTDRKMDTKHNLKSEEK